MFCKNFGVKPPAIARVAFPYLVWKLPRRNKTVFLTFDDGPIPEITEWVLDILDSYQIKATFFCVGDNVQKHPTIFQKIIEKGHSTGNHTHNHLNCWKTSNSSFLKNIEESSRYIHSNLLRPPYGKMRHSLSFLLKKKYKIIMWDVLSKDYDKNITPEQCFNNVIRNTRNGSIIVFHDSIKAFENLKYALPKSIEYLLNNGYLFEKIEIDHSQS